MLRRLLSAVLLFSLPSLAATIPRFTDPDRRAKLEAAFPEITALFERYWRDQAVPGLTFGVVIDGDLALVKSFGELNRDTHAPVTPDSVFRIASMTKSFTALAVLQLRDEGKLSLEDPITKWLPEANFAYPTRDAAPIRIRTLLSHSAGFPEDNPWGDRQLAVTDAQLTAWLKKGLPFSTSPSTAYEYSNYGFALLGRIVTRVSGQPYADYIAGHILQPLKMSASTLNPEKVPAKIRADGYSPQGVLIPSLPHGAFGSMGGMLVSSRDLARYVAFHLAAWPPRDDPDPGPVRRSSVREMQTLARPGPLPPRAASAGYTGYGFGLRISQTCRFDHIVAHGGGLPGFGSYMQWLPDYGVGIFVMTNLTYTAAVPAVQQAFEALRARGGLRPRELPPSPELLSTRDAILRVWTNQQPADLSRIAAGNLFLDNPSAARLARIRSLRQELGACREPGAIHPENLLRGTFRMNCEHGSVDIVFTLAPTVPPLVQYLEFTAIPDLTPAFRKSAETLADAINHTDSERAHVSGSQLQALHLEHGDCRLGETLAFNGSNRGTVRLDCDRGPLQADLDLDPQGVIRNVSLMNPDDLRCAPRRP